MSIAIGCYVLYCVWSVTFVGYERILTDPGTNICPAEIVCCYQQPGTLFKGKCCSWPVHAKNNGFVQTVSVSKIHVYKTT